MKMKTSDLAQKVEENLKLYVPAHTTYVTHSPSNGVRVEVVFGGKTHQYNAGKSWTTCDMTIKQIARDYIAARYPTG